MHIHREVECDCVCVCVRACAYTHTHKHTHTHTHTNTHIYIYIYIYPLWRRGFEPQTFGLPVPRIVVTEITIVLLVQRNDKNLVSIAFH